MDFRVLGPFEVTGDGEVKLGGPQQRTLLALLVLRVNEVVSTDTLVEAIWDGRPPGSALPIIRTYVSRLRQALSSAGASARLVGKAPGYLLEVDPADVDAGRFERLVRQGRRQAEAGHADAAAATLTAALGLWRGEFLADLADRPCFRTAAARLDDLRMAALEDRIDADLALGCHGDVVGELAELTSRHPFRERLWGQRIVALYRSGRQADALGAYRAVRSTLVEQLGIAPGPALQRLEIDVLRQAQDLGWRPPSGRPGGGAEPAAAAVDRGGDPDDDDAGPRAADGEAERAALPVALAEGPESRALVGRTAELSRLGSSLRVARQGTFRAVFVAGPPGIGKTALVARCARAAHRDGAAVAFGRADEDLVVPYQALQAAIRQWVAGPPGAAELPGLGDADAARLSRLVPEIGEHRRLATEATGVDGEGDRHRLFEAIGRWVASLASRGPAVLVLEDLHWADHATLLALRHLLRHPPAAGVLVLVTYRETELAAGDRLASLVADTRRDDFVSHVELAGLRDDEVAELLQTEVGPVDGAGLAFAERLNRRTGGNPLFIHETLRHLTERGALSPGEPGWPGDRHLDALGVPTGVAEVLGRRLRHLPGPTTEVLRQAAVVGQQFDVPVLSRMLGMAEVAVLQALEPAVTSTLVGPVGRGRQAGGTDDFAFSHALVRDAIVETIPLADRPGAHWRAGRAIADVHASHRESHLEEVARHLVAGAPAGDTSTAVAASLEAGQRALGALAFEDAVEWFRTATGLVARTGPVDPELEFEAWFGLGSAALATGRWADHQRDGYLQAARLARARNWPDRFARSVIGLAFHSLGADDPAAGAGQGDGRSEVEQLGAEALARLGETAPAERAFLLGMATVLAVRWGHGPDAHRLAGLADEVAASADDPTALGGALLGRCWTLLGSPRPGELAETAERALALPLRAETRIVLHTLVLAGLVVAPLQLGDRAGLEAALARVSAHPEIQRSEHLAGYLRMVEAGIALASGRLDEAAQSAAAISGRDEWWIWHDTAEILSTAIAIERGQFDQVISRVGASLALMPDAAIPRAMLAAVESRRRRACVTGHQVEDLGRRVHDKLCDQPANWDSSILMALTGEVAARVEAPSLARDLLPVMSPYSGQMLISYLGATIVCAADRPLGQALLALGRGDEACARLEAARDLERSFGADALAAHSTVWLARAQLACGRRQLARDLVGEALADAERMGLRAVADDCRALSQSLP